MMATWRLRCLPVLLVVYYFVVTVDGTDTSGSASSSRGGNDRRNTANKHRRSTTPDPQDSSNSPQESAETAPVAWGQHDPIVPAPWGLPEADDRARHGRNVTVTRKTIHGGKTKGKKNGTHMGHEKHGTHIGHAPVTTTTEFSTTGTSQLATDHVTSSDLVTVSTAAADGLKRSRPSVEESSEITEPRKRTPDPSIPQRIPRVKKAKTPATHPTTTPIPATTAMTSLTTSKLPAVRKQHWTAATSTRTPPIEGRASSTTSYSSRTTSHQNSTKGEGCSSSCEMHRCETVEADACQGRVVKDRCNCCPVCLVEQSPDVSREEDVTTRKTSHHPSNACDGMQCPKHKVCILNIQGIPMCRCPNIYSCKGIERNPLCAQNGMTYKNKCFLKVEECTMGVRIRVNHRGSCRSKQTPAQLGLQASAMMGKTSRLESDHRMQQTSHYRKSGKNDPWRHVATNGDKPKSTKLRKREGNKSQYS